jgi:hypothetical protein
MLRVCANANRSIPVCRRQGKILLTDSRISTRHNHSTSSSQYRNISSKTTTTHYYQASLVGVALFAAGCTTWHIIVTPPSFPIRTQCELQVIAPVPEPQIVVKVDEKKLWHTIKRALRILRRMLKLMIVLSPLAALYPLQYLLHNPARSDGEDAHEIILASLKQKNNLPDGPIGWYYKLCLFCVEWSGAAAIKSMQWAGSRPDMFGPAFCAVFSQLQDDTTPHAWNHTEKALRKAIGEDWQEHIRLYEILGSGCIAQVYKGVLVLDTTDGNNEQEQTVVAVKVMHPNVDDDIDADLDIMRLSVRLLQKLPFDVFQNIRWLNLEGVIDEMDRMLKIQLDLRTEAKHLVRFNENFQGSETVMFPKVRKATTDGGCSEHLERMFVP